MCTVSWNERMAYPSASDAVMIRHAIFPRQRESVKQERLRDGDGVTTQREKQIPLQANWPQKKIDH